MDYYYAIDKRKTTKTGLFKTRKGLLKGIGNKTGYWKGATIYKRKNKKGFEWQARLGA